MSGPVRVIVTIDTEEDDWGAYRPQGNSVANIALLLELVPLWERFGVRPTYFVNHPPMASPEASEVLRSLARDTRCEMGVHCHPWNTPPLREVVGRPPTMMNGLSDEENFAKLSVLTSLFEERFGSRPRSFRAGRWGFGATVARPLHRLGYEVDSSVSPLLDWSRKGGPDYTNMSQTPYRFRADDPFRPDDTGDLVEIPTSVGFLWGSRGSPATKRAALEGSFLARVKIVGMLDVLGVFARRWISPETSSGREMIRLAKSFSQSGVPVLDLTFHSPSLLPGTTPFVRTEDERSRFMGRIRTFLEFCSRNGFVFSTASEVARAVRQGRLGHGLESESEVP